MDAYFAQFGLDLANLNQPGMCPLAVGNLPASFDLLRKQHMEAMLAELPASLQTAVSRQALRGMLNPNRNLIPNGELLHNIFRLLEYDNLTAQGLNDVPGLKRRAFTMRKNVDGSFGNGRVFPQPKEDTSGFLGCSCMVSAEHAFLQEPFLYSFQIAPLLTLGNAQFAQEMRRHREVAGGQNNRTVVSFRLASRTVISPNDWIVVHDQSGHASHVTVAVAAANGLAAEEVTARKFFIPDLQNMDWQLTTSMNVFKGKAEWRDDYFPDSPGWRDVISTFDLIMCQGELDEFFDTWRVHGMLHGQGRLAMNATLDLRAPIKLGRDTILSFLRSEACDGNEANTVAYNAVDFLENVLRSSDSIVVKAPAKIF
jgi:hypothetical protein